MSTYKIAVIGDKDSVIGFKALGLTAIPAESAEEARAAFIKTARDEEYAIIYITEQLARALETEITAVKEQVKPAVILIPSKKGTLGLGMSALSSAVERATGTSLI
jgi:V/A-type H+-transporting ATPase subunit F